MRSLVAALLEPVAYPSVYDVTVRAVGDGRISLAGSSDDLRSDGVFGLYSERAYGRIGAILERDPDGVVRRLDPAIGQLRAGDAAGVSLYAFPLDPLRGRGIAFDDVQVPGPLGPMAAWRIPGGSRWAVFVHGRGATREEGLRVLGVLHRLGLTVLLPTYRNDAGAPSSPDGLYHLGATEWEDVEAAVAYAAAEGAQDVVLVASSMGAALACRFLLRSRLAGRVSRVVLDAPLLDWSVTLRNAAARRGEPLPVAVLAKHLAAHRIDIRWRDLDHVRQAAAFSTPMLVVHGTEDRTVPFAVSRRLALARPDLVQLVAVPGAGHARSWNRDPDGYDHAVAGFLDGISQRARRTQHG
jgi:alpha-beta hydrolase superfamily lysophospholipase